MANNYFLIESSWEVCNKVGGIYTVITSKAPHMVKQCGEDFLFVGPYFEDKARSELQEEKPKGAIAKAIKVLQEQGLQAHYGTWLTEAEPKAVLIDFSPWRNRADDIKKTLWEKFGVDSLGAPDDFNEPIVWAWAVAQFAHQLQQALGETMILHTHEWLTGVAILACKASNAAVKTVFTTHATMLGRAMAGSDADLYGEINTIDPEQAATKYQVKAKWSLERACAQHATVMTTVSEVTGREVERFLGRPVDQYLPNGLSLATYPTFEDSSIHHARLRDQMREFLLYYFFPYYTFNPAETLFYFMAARYEFHNKGIDMMIDSLAQMNTRMKESGHRKTIVAFFYVPTAVGPVRPELADSKLLFLDIKDYIVDAKHDITSNLIYGVMSGESINEKTLIRQDIRQQLKKNLQKMHHGGMPPLSTHDILDPNDPIMRHLHEVGLDNKADDKVKVIFYPIYLSGADGLLNLTYNQCIQASHLGVFPSYYEPWGYTPLEAAALGVGAVTSDLSGFGKYLQSNKLGSTGTSDMPGVAVMKRDNVRYEQGVEELTDYMFTYANYTREDRVKNKIQARRIAEQADWADFVKFYFMAYEKALKK